MAKEITKIIKLQLPAGSATPAPPVGTVLGPAGVNIGEFVNQFNSQTRDRMGSILPVVMTVYKDRTFTFIIKKPPAPRMILKALGIESGSGTPHTKKVGKLTKAQVQAIAEDKMEDLNAATIDAAKRLIAGTARSMGVDVEK